MSGKNPFPSDRIIVGALCYVVHQGSVLLLRRNRPPHSDKWTAPGGKSELGESMHDTAIREIKEETDLTIHNPTLCGLVTIFDQAHPIHWHLGIFRADNFTGEATTGNTEEGELKWVKLAQVSNYAMPRTDELYLPKVLLWQGQVFCAKFVYDTPNTCVEEIFYTD